MSKNLIPEITQMLGVEIGEKFKIKGDDELTYKFDSDGLKITHYSGIEISPISANVAFINLVNGKDEIVKLPWKPTLDERYWTFTVRGYLESSSRTWTVRPGIWEKHPIDIALLKAGWVFRTRQEAEAALPAVAKAMNIEYKI